MPRTARTTRIATLAGDAAVTDEGHTHHGREEIRPWLGSAASEYTYTTAASRPDWADEPPARRSEPASVAATPAAATSGTHEPDVEPSDSELPGAGVVDPPAHRVEHGGLRWEGELWELEFAGRAARVRDVKGLHDLAVLLARPGAQPTCPN